MEQIKVTFILKGQLMFYSEGKKKTHLMKIDKNLRIKDVFPILNVPTEQINIVLKNNKRVDVETKMDEGDQIEIRPIIAGG